MAKHSAAQLLDTLLYWRTEALKGFKGKSLAISQKKVTQCPLCAHSLNQLGAQGAGDGAGQRNIITKA